MSKDFEQEYKELAQSEIPDLWDRIEAGLSEKSTPEKQREENQKKNHKKKIHFRIYTGMAAAVLCAVLIIPAALFMGRLEKTENYTTETEADQSELEERIELTECASENDGGETETVAFPDEMPKEETADLARAMMDTTSGSTQDDAVVEESRESASEAGEQKVEMEDSDEAKEEKMDSLFSSKQQDITTMEDGTVIERVTVDLIGRTMKETDDDDIDQMGVVCSVIVRKDESGFFEEGEQIEIFIPLYSSVALIEGSTYEVDLVYRSDEECPFLLKGVHFDK